MSTERFVQPTTHMIGFTQVDGTALRKYLDQTKQLEFVDVWDNAMADGVSPGEAICSLYAKLCYASLVEGRNANISKTRSIQANIMATLDHGHGSVFEHCWVNFITTNCSRVFTHELVRHRVGTAFSQTSGRYVRVENFKLVWDPILDPVKDDIADLIELIEGRYQRMVKKMGLDDQAADFDRKKKVTSALRRVLPNGQANEMGWSMNLRTARHLIMLRTSRHAEWEIRLVFNQVYQLLIEKFPLMFYDAKIELVDGLHEVTGMKTQPYETMPPPKQGDYHGEVYDRT